MRAIDFQIYHEQVVGSLILVLIMTFLVVLFQFFLIRSLEKQRKAYWDHLQELETKVRSGENDDFME